MFLDRFRCLHGLRNAPAFLVTIACSMALLACGGGGGASNSPGPGSGTGSAASKSAELSLVVGKIETFNGTGANARITRIGQIDAKLGLRLLDGQGQAVANTFASFDHFNTDAGVTSI